MLDNVASGLYSGRIEDSVIVNKEFLPANQAYLDLVEQKYSGTFRNILSGDKSDLLLASVYSVSLSDLRKVVLSNARISDPQLLDYIILMNLYSEFYLGSIARDPIIRLMNLLAGQGASLYIEVLATTVIKSMTALLPGNEPPEFSLPDESGKKYSPDMFRGKFLLLSFARTDLKITLMEYGLLKMWNSKYRNDLQVVTILKDEQFDEAMARIRNNEFEWIFLNGSDSDILDFDYDIRLYPSFMLIDREGKILNNTCPMPSENLETYFRSILEKASKPSGF